PRFGARISPPWAARRRSTSPRSTARRTSRTTIAESAGLRPRPPRLPLEHERPSEYVREEVDRVQDDREGERVRLVDAVGLEPDQGGRLEHPHRARRRGQDERQPRRDRHEQAGEYRQPQMEADHQDPRAERERNPGDGGEDEGSRRETRVAQRG